ncbi:MAG: SDR family oxidoreductase [Pirellulales bacterium]
MLTDKVILVMGGTSGIGLSAVGAIVRSGGRAVVVGPAESDWGPVMELPQESVVCVVGDAREPNTASLAIDTACARFGHLDGLYHVAGGSGRKLGDGPLHELTDAGWEGTIGWNLTSVMISNRAVVRYWIDSTRGGAIVNVGSVLATHPSPSHFATHAYAAAKSALIGLTRSTASYYASRGIRVNLIAPGLIATPMSARAQRDETIQDYVREKQPLSGGMGLPSDLDGAVVYLLSDASRLVTGQVLDIDGGWSVTTS